MLATTVGQMTADDILRLMRRQLKEEDLWERHWPIHQAFLDVVQPEWSFALVAVISVRGRADQVKNKGHFGAYSDRRYRPSGTRGTREQSRTAKDQSISWPCRIQVVGIPQ